MDYVDNIPKSRTEKIAFDYTTTTGTAFLTLPKNKRVRKVSVVIDEEFDDQLSSISVGISGEEEKYTLQIESDLKKIGEYNVNPNIVDLTEIMVRVYINSGISTQGSGTIYLSYV